MSSCWVVGKSWSGQSQGYWKVNPLSISWISLTILLGIIVIYCRKVLKDSDIISNNSRPSHPCMVSFRTLHSTTLKKVLNHSLCGIKRVLKSLKFNSVHSAESLSAGQFPPLSVQKTPRQHPNVSQKCQQPDELHSQSLESELWPGRWSYAYV